MGRGGDSAVSLHEVHRRSEGEDGGGGFWQNVLHGIVLRKTPSQSRLRGILASWLEPPPTKRDDGEENIYIQRPAIGRYGSAAAIKATRASSVHDSDGDNGGGTSSGRSSGSAPHRAPPAPARLHTYGVSALTDCELFAARSSFSRDPFCRGVAAVELPAQADVATAPAAAAAPSLKLLHQTSPDSRHKSTTAAAASPGATAEATGQPDAEASPRRATAQTDSHTALALAVADLARLSVKDDGFKASPVAKLACLSVKEDVLKASPAVRSPLSHITRCCDCAEPIVGAVYMLNDRSYCCQRHRLNAYHREERVRMTERDERITHRSPLHRSPSRSWSKPDQPSSPTGASPADPPTPSGASGIAALFPAWI
jgi:hypothetical protein